MPADKPRSHRWLACIKLERRTCGAPLAFHLELEYEATTPTEALDKLIDKANAIAGAIEAAENDDG